MFIEDSISEEGEPIQEGRIFEDSMIVKTFKSYLPRNKEAGRKSALVQFYELNGGLRTVKARDIMEIRKA